MSNTRDAWAAEILKRAKPHKYGARKKVVDGITFDSTKEARRYCELKMLEKAGRINQLTIQPSFDLYVHVDTIGEKLRRSAERCQGKEPTFARIKIGSYVGDFSYRHTDTNERVIEDVKGYDVPLGRWKRRHAEAQYGITVTLIK